MFLLAAILAAVLQLQPGDTALCNNPAPPVTTTVPTAAPTAKPSAAPTPPGGPVTSWGPRLFITRSGTYDGHGAGVKGVDIAASDVTLQNYDISTQASGNNGYGIYVHGQGVNHVTIQHNLIHDLCRDGVFMEGSVSYVKVQANTITRASMAAVNINGQNDTAGDNDISEIMQHPKRAGGKFAGCQDENGSDADGFRFFGSGHVISGNKIYGIEYGTNINPDPHVDCFMTWGTNERATKDIAITNNHCWWPKTSAQTDNEVSSIEALEGAVSNVTFRNNVFANMRQGINVGRGVGAIIFDRNTVDGILMETLIWETPPTSASQITNNIFWRHGGGEDAYTTHLQATIGSNDCVAPSGKKCGTYPVEAPALAVDPLFISVGAANLGTNDYHLKPSSPVPTMGAFPLR